MIFYNRAEAAKALIPHLGKFRNDRVLVLAIPRGGVVIGYEIATYFGWPLDLLLTKKIGHPANSEYAIGAVSLYTACTNNRHPEIPQEYILSEISRIRTELAERRSKFLASRKEISIHGKVVILVDDGIATGFTMRISVELTRMMDPARIVVAVPVASPRTVSEFQDLADEFIVLETPHDFNGVGQYYQDFSEVTDADVLAMLMTAYN